MLSRVSKDTKNSGKCILQKACTDLNELMPRTVAFSVALDHIVYTAEHQLRDILVAALPPGIWQLRVAPGRAAWLGLSRLETCRNHGESEQAVQGISERKENFPGIALLAWADLLLPHGAAPCLWGLCWVWALPGGGMEPSPK